VGTPLPRPSASAQRPLRVLVVDDEPTARQRLARLLGEIPDVSVVGESPSGRDALRDARALAPDVVFLDVSMPGLDGIAVARRLAAAGGDEAGSPLVVFVTAHDEHALEAFRLHAADYVLKPLERERLRDAVEHARVAVRRARMEGVAPPTADGAPPRPPRLAVRDGYRTHLVPIAEILWVESFGNYTRVYTPASRYLHRETMARLTAQLAPHGFVRIHRGTIVNASRIVRLRPGGSGQYQAYLDTGQRLRVSRTFRGALDAALGVEQG
jgi:two-component system, LytTR family, response regulator